MKNLVGHLRASRFTLLLCMWMSLPSLLWAQAVSSTLLGTVTDPSGAVIHLARLTITNLETGILYVAITDDQGRYRLPGLPPGNYQLRLERDKFKTHISRGITLAVAQQVELNWQLEVGEISEEVTTTTQAPLVESVTSTVSGLVSSRQMSELPLNGRDLFQLVLLQAGATPMHSAGPSPLSKSALSKVSINGMRPTWNNVTFDGMDANDPAFNLPPGGASGLLLGIEAIREFRVLTQTYSAEYGRNAGAIIEAITKSGSNRLHGSLFEFHRNAAFDAKNYFDLAKRPIPPFTRNQFGTSLGGALARDRTFYFLSYEGLRERLGVTANATVPNALAHQGMLPSQANPSRCTASSNSGCIRVGVDARIRPFLALYPLPNGQDFGNGTGQLITSDKRNTDEDYFLVRMDHARSTNHFLFGRYIIDDSSAMVPYFSTFVPGFPIHQQGRNQYFTLQDQKSLGTKVLNEFRLGINRTTYLSSIVNRHPGLTISLLPRQPLGALGIAGSSVLGNNAILPIGAYSTTSQVQNKLLWTSGRHALKFGGEFRRIHSNGPTDFLVNGLYNFLDLSLIGLPTATNNPPLEAFLKAQPLVFAGTDPALSDSNRGYRHNEISAFVQDDLRLSSSLTVNAGLRYEYYSNPTEAHGRISAIRNPATDSAPTVGRFFARTPTTLFSPRLGFAWNLFADGKTVLRGGAGIFRDQIWVQVYSLSRFLPPFFKTVTAVLPRFLDPLQAAAFGTAPPGITTYFPEYPYALQYNLNLQRELTPNTVIKVEYIGARGYHLQHLGEVNPFEPAQGRRLNPNFDSLPFVATDGQSFYNALHLGFEKRYALGLAFQAFYTFSKSIDDASNPFPTDAVNEPAKTQNLFNRQGDRGRSSFDIRHNFVVNFTYELPFGHGKTWGSQLGGWANQLLAGWQISGIGSFHSNVPFTAVLGFDNADTRSLLLSDRPDLIGDPYAGVCPNGASVGTVECWFNPNAFAVPQRGKFGNAGRNILKGPDFKNFDLALLKRFPIQADKEIQLRAEIFNLANHPNFGVPLNSQGSIIHGGNGNVVFVGRDPNGKGIVPGNAGRIFSTVNASRQIQLGLKFIF